MANVRDAARDWMTRAPAEHDISSDEGAGRMRTARQESDGEHDDKSGELRGDCHGVPVG